MKRLLLATSGHVLIVNVLEFLYCLYFWYVTLSHCVPQLMCCPGKTGHLFSYSVGKGRDMRRDAGKPSELMLT